MDDNAQGDDELAYDDEPFDEELAELCKPEPMSFPDDYEAHLRKPVELVVPRHADAFKAIEYVKDARFPAKRVANSAVALAKTLRAMRKVVP